MTLQPIFDYKILFKSLIDRKSSGNRVLIKSGRLAFNYIISAILYLTRYIFDCIDGFYARKYNMTTVFGDWYDHISDILINLIYIYDIIYLIINSII